MQSKFKRVSQASTLAVLLSLAGFAAHASGARGGVNIGGNLSGYSVTVGGNAGSSATSSGQVATEVIGSGKAFESQGNVTQSGAALGSKITSNGVAVTTSSFGNTVSKGEGKVSGNTPQLSSDGSQSILNGGASFGDAESGSAITSRFDKAQVGVDINLHGAEFGNSF